VSKRFASLEELPAGAIVGTSSLRRESQLRAQHPRLKVEPLRGNVETRLRKLDEGQFAAIILAAAGLKRLNLGHRITVYLSPEQSLPAVGQGALGIEYRFDRNDVGELLSPLTNTETTACVLAERAMSRKLAGSCEVPLGAHATIADGTLRLTGFVASPDGRELVFAEISGKTTAAEALGQTLADQLLVKGAAKILTELQLRT
jgi:hydroxymethylbilane synthase